VLRAPVRRWTTAERDKRIASAPEFGHRPPGSDEFLSIVDGYVGITGDPVRTRRKRNLIAACYRVHGDDFLPIVQELFWENGSATNLLGEIRCLPPRMPGGDTAEAREPGMSRRPLYCGCSVTLLLPNLIYCGAHRPPFDGDDRRRHDRHPSNPEAAQFFDRSVAGDPGPVEGSGR
jgi:hypothetical protein